jgi:predicted nuclease of predicted toxin-antitoxin system
MATNLALDDIDLTTAHLIKAAEFRNLGRGKGVQGSTTDFLICAVAHIEHLLILTTDSDFKNYQKHL